jgi:hypothetical protein
MKDGSLLAIGAAGALAALSFTLQRRGSGAIDYADPAVAELFLKAQTTGESLAMSEFITAVSKNRHGGPRSIWDDYLSAVQRRAEAFRGRGTLGRTGLAPLLEDRLVQSAEAHARWLLRDTQILEWWPAPKDGAR